MTSSAAGDGDPSEPVDPGRGGWRQIAGELRPAMVDVAMVVAGAATVIFWSGGIPWRWFGVVASVWMGLWVWRLSTRGLKVWGPLAALVTVVVVMSGVPHVAHRLGRGCAGDIATAMLVDEPMVPIENVSYAAYGRSQPGGVVGEPAPGGCGLLRWRHAAVIDINEYGRGAEPGLPVMPAVVLFDAGPHQLHVFTSTENGYVYSPDAAPATCRAIAGRPNANNGYASCTVDDLGGGWYWYVAENAAD
jgi:hypothetical protein